MANTETEQFKPDYGIPPGEILLEALEERGMSTADLARMTGLSIRSLGQLLVGSARLTPAIADSLEQALDIPAEMWAGLEKHYREHLAAQSKAA